ncbi:reverse transcriptase domain, reverse transcriptase zinc-binding domain protein [Tanacetum coccineum]
MWMAVQGRLTTQERLLKWYLEKQMSCSLCGACPDSLNHLFFDCHYSSKVWRRLKKLENFDYMPDKWDAIMAAMTQLRHNRSIKSVLRRIILAACVYFIWNGRNKRLFTSDKKDSLTAEIVNYVRLKLTSHTVKRTSQTEEVCKLWKVELDMKLDDILLESLT